MPRLDQLISRASTVALLALAPAVSTAQVLPGGSIENGGSIRAQFIDAVMAGVRETTTTWSAAWSRSDASALAALYLEEAFLVTPEGTEEGGREDILGYLEESAPRVRRIDTFLFDMDASNDMAMIAERYELHPAGTGATQHGLLFTVLLRRDGRWHIRSQVFRPGNGLEGGDHQEER